MLFIGGGNLSARRNVSTCCKSCKLYRVHLYGDGNRTRNSNGDIHWFHKVDINPANRALTIFKLEREVTSLYNSQQGEVVDNLPVERAMSYHTILINLLQKCYILIVCFIRFARWIGYWSREQSMSCLLQEMSLINTM